ncbi:hypothetical protein D3C79_972410 [compost metagenome]
MASGYPRPAIRHQLLRRPPGQLFGKALLELIHRQEAPISPQVVGKRRALGPGNMPRHRVDRLYFTAKTRQGTRIDQGQVSAAQALAQVFGIDQQLGIRLTTEGAFAFGR